jgi:hypothetical protein
MIMLHPLAARVKKPGGILWSGLFAIKPPSHLSNKENLRFLYSLSVIGGECCMLRRSSMKRPFSLLAIAGCHVRRKCLPPSVKKLSREIKGRLESVATGFFTTRSGI